MSEGEMTIRLDDCWNRIGVWSDRVSERCIRLKEVIHCRNCKVYSTIGRQLLDRPVPDKYRREWTALFSRSKQVRKANIHSAFVFRTGGEWLALPGNLIQEVVDMGVIHSLPHRNNRILRGIVNVRGKLELCFSIGAVLGIERLVASEKRKKYVSPERLVVAERNGERIVFPVSQVFGGFRYGEGMLQPLPVTVSGSRAAFTRGILCVEDFEAGLLDDRLLFEALMRNMA